MQFFKKFEKAMGAVLKVVSNIASLIMIIMMLLIVAFVAGRPFNKVLLGTEEYVALFQVVMVGLGLAYTQHNKGFVHVGFFMKKLPAQLPMIAWTLGQWTAAIICVFWTYESVLRVPVVKSLSQVAALPYKPFMAVFTVGIVLLTISQTFEAVKCTIGLFNKEIRQEIQDEWPA